MPSRIDNLLAEARAALITDPNRAVMLLEEVAQTLRAKPAPVNAHELAAVAKLARNGESLWRAWGRLLGVEPGYTADGVPPPQPHASSIAVQG